MLIDLLYEAIKKYRHRISLTHNNLSRKTTLNRSTNFKIRQKHRLWKFYLQSNDINVYSKYCKISNQTLFFMQQSITNLEKYICEDDKASLKTLEGF